MSKILLTNFIFIMKKENVQSITYILSGSLLQMFNGVGSNWTSTLAAIFGVVLIFMGLKKFKEGLDEAGQGAVKMINIAVIISIVGLIIDIIPLMGLVASIILLVAFVFELLGLLKLKKSESIGEVGKSGVTFLLVAMILGIVTSLFGIIPFLGSVVGTILSLAALVFVFFGWLRIQDGLLEK